MIIYLSYALNYMSTFLIGPSVFSYVYFIDIIFFYQMIRIIYATLLVLALLIGESLCCSCTPTHIQDAYCRNSLGKMQFAQLLQVRLFCTGSPVKTLLYR